MVGFDWFEWGDVEDSGHAPRILDRGARDPYPAMIGGGAPCGPQLSKLNI